VLYVSDVALYSIRSGILSQWSFLRIGFMWWCFGVLVTARARAFRIAWERFIEWCLYVQEKRIAVV